MITQIVAIGACFCNHKAHARISNCQHIENFNIMQLIFELRKILMKVSLIVYQYMHVYRCYNSVRG